MDIRSALGQAGYTLTYTYTQPGRAARYQAAPAALHPRLQQYIRSSYPCGLYRHQSMAINLSLAGEHVALATSTASGKSEAFFLPVLNMCLQHRDAKAIFVYPLKALGADQFEKMRHHCAMLGLGSKAVARFDGSVATEERREALQSARILCCTPDVLHVTILREQKDNVLYKSFLGHVRYVVLDECHTYSGAFGSNVAYVIRRLRQVLKRLGTKVQFIAASATSADPVGHLRQLTGLDFRVITDEDNGAPAGDRAYYLATPRSQYDGKMALQQLIKGLLRQQVRFLVFMDSRQGIERQYVHLLNDNPSLHGQVSAYRSGYEVEDRRQIEAGLKSGRLLGVISTSALELGVDIADMDVCILCGLPNTKMQLMQRAGRVGRRGQVGHVVILRSPNAVDDYYFDNPNEVFSRSYEPLIINLNNEPLMLSHWACARYESPCYQNPDLDPSIFGAEFVSLSWRINDFAHEWGILDSQIPHFSVPLRCIGDDSYDIHITTAESERIGTINHSQLLHEAYPQAIYLHAGRPYRVRHIDYSHKRVMLDPRCPRYTSTSPVTFATVTPRLTAFTVGAAKLWRSGVEVRQGYFNVTQRVTGYRERGTNHKDDVQYDRPLLRFYVTQGVAIRIPSEVAPDFAALSGAGNALANCYPVIQPCASEEIGVHFRDHEQGASEIYLYDTTPGGLAITWPILDHFAQLAAMAKHQVESCPHCRASGQEAGCIRCVRRLNAGQYESRRARPAALELLRALDEMVRDQEPTFVPARVVGGRSSGGTGGTMLGEGVLVVTGSNEQGLVLGSQVSRTGEREYRIQINGEQRIFRGSRLSLVEGEIFRWCTACGAERLPMDSEECPICSALL